MLVIVKSDKHQVFQNQSPCWLVQLSGSDYFQANSTVGTSCGDRKLQEAECLAQTQVLLWLHLPVHLKKTQALQNYLGN